MSTYFGGLRKNFAGRRCEQETLRQRFLAQPDGQHGLRRVLRSQHSFLAAICVYSRSSAVKKGSSSKSGSL
jgi:hypothetical protein